MVGYQSRLLPARPLSSIIAALDAEYVAECEVVEVFFPIQSYLAHELAVEVVSG